MLALSKASILAALFLIPLGTVVGVITESAPMGLFAMVMGLAAWYKPSYFFLLLIALAPLSRSPKTSLISPDTIANAKIIGAFILGAVWLLQGKILKRDMKLTLPNWIYGFVLIWLVLTTLSTAASMDVSVSLRYMAAMMGGIVLFWIGYQSNDKESERILNIVLFVGAGVALIGILQYVGIKYEVLPGLMRFIVSSKRTQYFASNIGANEDLVRVEGTFMHPNHLGIYMAILIPFACAVLTLKNLSWQKRTFYFCALALFLGGLYASNSRAGFLAAGVSLGFLSLHRQCRWLIMVGLIGFGGLGAAYIHSPKDVSEYLIKKSRVKGGLSSRGPVWRNAIRLIEKSPVLGIGPGNFSNAYVKNFGYFVYNDPHHLRAQLSFINIAQDKYTERFHAHNIFLQIGSEGGIWAPFIFVFGVALVVVQCLRRAAKASGDPFARALALSAASAALGVLFYGFFESPVLFTKLALNHMAGPMLALGLKS